MVKLIASDLDGTLLTSKKELPEGTFDLIRQLHRHGILFAPASGRQYANLKRLFAPVEDEVVFICENGALVKYRGETLYRSPIDGELLKHALDEIRPLPHLYPMLCGEDYAYIEDDAQPFYRYSLASYTNCKKVDSLDEVIGRENICKIAIYDGIAAAENCYKVLPQRLPKLRTILSGFDWCDVANPETNKGVAVRILCEHFGIAREECVAFGDHMNDYEMLKECGTAYVPEDAYPPLKALFPHTVPTADDDGVLLKIKEILNEQPSP